MAGSIALVAVLAAIPSWSQRTPVSGRADGFVRPFYYQVPADSDIRVDAKSDHLNVLSAPPGNQQGISMWLVGDVLRDHCSNEPDSALAPRQSGVDGLLSYIRSVPHLHVEDIGAVAIDGRPAFKVELTVADGVNGCPDPDNSIFLWRDTSPSGDGTVMQVPVRGRVPLTVVDVDGATVAIEVWRGGPIDEWIPVADGAHRLDPVRQRATGEQRSVGEQHARGAGIEPMTTDARQSASSWPTMPTSYVKRLPHRSRRPASRSSGRRRTSPGSWNLVESEWARHRDRRRPDAPDSHDRRARSCPPDPRRSSGRRDPGPVADTWRRGMPSSSSATIRRGSAICSRSE